MAGSLWNKVKGFGENVVKYSKTANYVDRAIKGAAIGGAIGGVSQWAQGGSFWEGTKSGAFQGAAIGAGYTAIRAGLGKETIAAASSKAAGILGNPGSKYSSKAWRMGGAGQKEATQAAAQAAETSVMGVVGKQTAIPRMGTAAAADYTSVMNPLATTNTPGVSNSVTAIAQMNNNVVISRSVNGLNKWTGRNGPYNRRGKSW